MNPLAWLISLVLPACGYSGAQGLPTPPVMDMAHITRPASPNTALAGPEGFSPQPDIVTPAYRLSPNRLLTIVRKVADAEPRTFIAGAYPDAGQVHYVVRSAVLNFPDLVTAQVNPVGESGSRLILYSRSVYGYGDLGVNRRRLAAWLSAINADIPSSER